MMAIEAMTRLETLIRKSRVDLYKPIAVAEILYRNRCEQLNLENKDLYRRKSYEWMRDIAARLHQKIPTLNSRYWDQLFDPEVMPPKMLAQLGEINIAQNGSIEMFIYEQLKGKFLSLHQICTSLETLEPRTFKLQDFLSQFEQDMRFSRSVDKIYEIVVYALFNAVVEALEARVSLSIVDIHSTILVDFEDFTKLILGIDTNHPIINQPARLFRVGTANANDAGLDMWANFGPAVQVKHLTLSPNQAADICQGVRADQVIIVCKEAEAEIIDLVISQFGGESKLRGIITEKDLIRWYGLCFETKYCQTLGQRLLNAIIAEFRAEFPLSDADRFDLFFKERKYHTANH